MNTLRAETIGGPLDGAVFEIDNEIGDSLIFNRNYHDFSMSIEKEGVYKPLMPAIYKLMKKENERIVLIFERMYKNGKGKESEKNL